MPLGVLTVGSLALNENYAIQDSTNAQSGVRTVNIAGIEMYPGRTLAQVRALADDLTSMYGKTVPVTFQHKTDRSGYYTIDDVNTSAVHWQGEAASFTWSLGLTRIGPDNAVDIESRMTFVMRGGSGSGERWHAPPIGHQAYYLGAVSPTTVTRTGADGPIVVYRNIPAVNPRYSCPVGSFIAGRVRFADINGIERTGTGIKIDASWWDLNNGLVRVRPASAGSTTLLVAFHDGTAWREKAWDIRIDGTSLVPSTDFLGATVLRNDPEMVSIRILSRNPSTGNRVLVDLVLRRGARFVEGYVQRTTAGQIIVCLDVLEASTDNGLYVTANALDANGIRSAIGTYAAFSLAANGGISVASTAGLSFWIGAEIGGSPAAGDAASVLQAQYISAASEATMAVAR